MNDHDDDILSGDIEDALPEEEVLDEEEGGLDLEADGKKKKDLIDEDTVSLEDEEEEELAPDPEEETFDDIYDK